MRLAFDYVGHDHPVGEAVRLRLVDGSGEEVLQRDGELPLLISDAGEENQRVDVPAGFVHIR